MVDVGTGAHPAQRGLTADPPAEAPTGEELTEILLHAAAEVFAEQGYERAGVAEIARRAGVTTGAIYSRYTGKAEMLLAAVDMHVPDEIQQLLRTDHPGESATDVLASLGSHLVDDLPSGYGLFLEAIVAGRRDPELAAAIRRRVEDEDAKLAKLVDEATTDGLFDPDLDRFATVRLAHAIGFGMTLTRAMGLDLPKSNEWTAVIDRVIGALATQDNNPTKPTSDSPGPTGETK
ncbi:MAG: TetR/AcrR family transcriptional regulator [Acidimicrobiia bacterium]|nr:TetR/AcrR family transcriptional regulator [Actinomycetota bacterium]MBL6926499.1 TetR/AcrR family transcriptional regulator [Acidimicrobiia bacterium]